MNRRFLSFSTLAVLAALSFVPNLFGTPQDDFEWLTDLDAARVQAKREGKPLLVVFR